jgi:transcription-repair coupling factor (superfamily II helicase)
VPEASYTIAHGQMNEHELESHMTHFVSGDVDVLVCTTIIESGLDIPNANTIIINRADNFGLADLHQLRGRVGRYKNRAYAYFLVPPDKPITQKSMRRLKAIEEYSELGAGFKIAMRDLEIRGAGNILGAEQSGHIAAVGYDLYCKLLDQTVRELKNEEVPQQIAVDLDINLDAYVPDDYAPDPSLKMGVYRKLAGATELEEIDDLADELNDRFGPMPEPVDHLLERHRVRVLAHKAGITYIARRKGLLLVNFSDPTAVNKLFANTPYTVRLIDAGTLHLHLPGNAETPWQIAQFLRMVLSGEAAVGSR